jgi:hypothetical protein
MGEKQQSVGRDVSRRSVKAAVEILGGNEAVAKYLGVRPEDVLSWTQGRSEPDFELFLRIVALIEERTVNAARTATVVRSRRDEGG